MNPQILIMLQQAIQAFQNGSYERADSILSKIIKVDSKNLPAFHILGLVKASQNEFKEAAELLSKAARLDPNEPSIRYNLAKALMDSGAFKESIPHHKKSVELSPNNPEAWLNYGKGLVCLKLYDQALECYDQALRINSDCFEAHLDKGIAMHMLKRYEEAIASYDKAIYLNPNGYLVFYNKGLSLSALKKFEEAIASYDKAIFLKPEYLDAWIYKGSALAQLKRYEEAISQCNHVLNVNSNHPDCWAIKAATMSELNQPHEAVIYYEKAIGLNPDMDWIVGDFIYRKMQISNWTSLEKLVGDVAEKVFSNRKVTTPFPLLSLSDNAILHKKCSEIYTRDRYPENYSLGQIAKRPDREKIRIAYFSGDFRAHAVAFLTAELFEIHNRERFEIFAFSFQNAPAGDEMNLRLRKCFDRFLDVEDMTDIQIAQLSRELNIDIAIDLSGLTQYSRTGIFSYRAAPIQVNWLGYPGTMGANYIDYIIADRTIIPESHQQFFMEKVVCLPNTYMVDDSKRVASSSGLIRKEYGLPENAFVFCCFNNGYKFNPKVLDGWSRIMLAVENSVLWVSENNENFRANLIIEFKKRGIDSMRIIFAQREELMANHLARYTLADLFLDTYPYNAHTTTVDSLKAGTPVLTLMGQSFASRVAASLLNAIGLSELITSTQEEYEALAIELAINSQKLADIKLKLASNRLTTPLFDTPLFTKNLEAAYIKMYEGYHAGLEPEHITIT